MNLKLKIAIVLLVTITIFVSYLYACTGDDCFIKCGTGLIERDCENDLGNCDCVGERRIHWTYECGGKGCVGWTRWCKSYKKNMHLLSVETCYGSTYQPDGSCGNPLTMCSREEPYYPDPTVVGIYKCECYP
jgi:hypothetical protein